MFLPRKQIRLIGHDYSDPGYYFVTLCTSLRKCRFGSIQNAAILPTSLGRLVEGCWNDLPGHFNGLKLGSFVVMPNHVHGLLLFPTTSFTIGVPHQFNSLGDVIGGFKSAVSRKSGIRLLWQRGYYDRVVRNEKELHRIADYIRLNPMRWHSDEHNPDRDPHSVDDFVEFFRAGEAGLAPTPR